VNTVPNGRPAVTFGSTNPANGQALYNNTYNNSGSTISVFLVTRQNGGPAWQKTLSATDGTRAADKNTCFDFNHYNDNLHPGVERQWDNHIAVNMDPAAEYHAEEFICTGSGNNYWYTTASATTAGTVSGTMSTANLTVNRFSVGGGLGTGTTLEDPIQGDVCELLVYTADQSANRTAIETYLQNKWLKSITVISAGVYVAPATGPTLNVSRTGNTLNFTWTGACKLQSQTNSLSTGISTNWSDHPGGGFSPVSVTIDPANPTMYFRLISQ
jgi:hypothetical protein